MSAGAPAAAPEGLTVRRVGPEAAADVLAVVRAAFGARPPLDPPAEALAETEASLAAALASHGGLVAEREGRVVGALLLDPVADRLWLRRVGVVPGSQEHGVATALVDAALSHAGSLPGCAAVAVLARGELPASIRFWVAHGFAEVDRRRPYVVLERGVPHAYDVVDGEQMQALGRGLGAVLRAGDLVVLTGGLGAGKTTLTQGIGAGLGVRGQITSPTFVIARVHPSEVGGPALVHVDAYRLGGVEELDDLDLDTDLEDAVTVVEWGGGVAEGLADSRLEVRIERAEGDRPEGAADPRRVLVAGVGARWTGDAAQGLAGLGLR